MTILWLPTGIYASDINPTEPEAIKYQYTVTGKIRIKKKSLPSGKVVKLNGHTIAIFRRQKSKDSASKGMNDYIFAMNNACPHMGGPMHLGDIEDLVPDTGVLKEFSDPAKKKKTAARICTVKCPWHGWTFRSDTGSRVIFPGKYSSDEGIKVFPTRVNHAEEIEIGFLELEPSLFTTLDD